MLTFRALLILFVLVGCSALSAQPAPAWAARFWQGIDVSDLSRGCVQRAGRVIKNANDAAISPDVPKDVLSTMKLLVIFPHPTEGPEMITHVGQSWYFHAVVTYEYQAERYVMDGCVPGQAVPYCDWILGITSRALSKYQVFLAEPGFRGLYQNQAKRFFCGCDAWGKKITPSHPVMLMPDEVVVRRPDAYVEPTIVVDMQPNPPGAEREPVDEIELPVPADPDLRLALLIIGFRLLAHHALFGQSGSF